MYINQLTSRSFQRTQPAPQMRSNFSSSIMNEKQPAYNASTSDWCDEDGNPKVIRTDKELAKLAEEWLKNGEITQEEADKLSNIPTLYAAGPATKLGTVTIRECPEVPEENPTDFLIDFFARHKNLSPPEDFYWPLRASVTDNFLQKKNFSAENNEEIGHDRMVFNCLKTLDARKG